MAIILSFTANLENCTNLVGHKNESNIRAGKTVVFSPYGDEIWIMNGSEMVWNENIFINKNGTFTIA